MGIAAAALLAVAAALILVTALAPFPARQMVLINDLATAGMALVAGVGLGVGAARSRGQLRAAWLLIAVGLLAWSVGEFGGAWYDFTAGATPFPSWLDVFYLLGYPAMIAGAITLGAPRRLLAQARTLLSGIAFVSTGFAVIWHLILLPTYTSSSSSLAEKLIGGAYPLGDLLLFIPVALAVTRFREPSARAVVSLFCAGAVAIVFADSAFAYIGLHDTTSGIQWLQLTWTMGYVLISGAAVCQLQWPMAGEQRSAADAVSATRQAAPLLMLAGLIAFAIWHRDSVAEDTAFQVMFFLSTTAMLLRELILLNDNAHLNASLTRAGESLEERVAERTAELTRMVSIIESTTDLVGITGPDQRFTYLNKAGRRMLGISDEASIDGLPIGRHYPDWAASIIEQQALPTALRDGVWEGETTALRSGNREIPVSQTIIAHRDAAGTPEFYSVIARDISERMAYEARLRELAAAIELTPDFVIILDGRGGVRYTNKAILAFLASQVGHDVPTATVADLRSLMPLWAQTALAEQIMPAARRDGSWSGESALCAQDGREVPVSLAVIAHHDESGAIQFVSLIGRDVTAQKQLENELRVQAFEDPLTGLANRTRLIERLEHALVRARRTGEHVAVLFLDLDEFKSVNDTHGHDVGDALLRAVSERIAGAVREGDTTARLGGDEFAFVLEGVADAGEAEATAARIVDSLRLPLSVAGIEVIAHASVGIALSQGDEVGSELLRRADLAMYTSKANGKNRSTTFNHTIQEAMGARLQLISELPGALDRGEFVVRYQPTIDIASGAINGAEALLRWQHPTRGLLSPVLFIPLAEESGAIVEIGNWVLATACAQLAEWQRRGAPDMTVAVNVAARQLHEPNFVDVVRSALTRFNLAPASLTVEITESAAMVDTQATLDALRGLKALGTRIAIDDFGTGYSSLSHLSHFPFDILKVDKSFVDSICDADVNLTAAIVSIARTLHLEVVAEGVENADQLRRLRSLGCDTAQGYLISRPVPAAEVTALLRAEHMRERAG